MADPILECDPIDPHPDAVYSGTCPAPDGWTPPPDWQEPDASDDDGVDPTEPLPTNVPTHPATSSQGASASASGDSDTSTGADAGNTGSGDHDALPVTGTDIGAFAGLGGGLLLMGALILVWAKRRRRA